jgi:hypothetical protein
VVSCTRPANKGTKQRVGVGVWRVEVVPGALSAKGRAGGRPAHHSRHECMRSVSEI